MRYLLALLLSGVLGLAVAAPRATYHEIITQLDHELEMKDLYDSRKRADIDSLRQKMLAARPGSREQCRLLSRIGLEYETFISDSALAYYDAANLAAQQLRDTVLQAQAQLGRVKVLSITGFFHEAVLDLDTIEQRGVPKPLTELWLDCGRQLYSYLEVYTLQGNSSNMNRPLQVYQQRQHYYRSRQLEMLPEASVQHKLFYAEQLYIDGHTTQAKKLLNEIIDTLPADNNIYARAAANMALIRQAEDNPEDAARYFAMSAIADIRTPVKETTSLQKLAFYLYEAGDINRAYNYISASLSDAVFCNARLRTTEISNIMPLIDRAYKEQLREKRIGLVVATTISMLLAIGFVGACFFLLRQMRKLKATRLQLKTANNIKDEYIGHFLDLCSIYMDRLDNFCKTVTRKITAGQVEDLVKMTKSSKFAEEQHKEFYENFDSAFLHIYPTFIDDFNQLLQPQERIVVKEHGKLTTELRIFAFLRMGVDDANKIANFLHYSVNTIYAYRNKVKNKAIDREHFEENIMKIGSIA